MNIHTTKKNCNRCAAGRHNRCELGYLAIWEAYDDHGFTVFGTPQEPCPKPRTNADFLYANKWYRKAQLTRHLAEVLGLQDQTCLVCISKNN